MTYLQALQGGGGPGLDGATKILLDLAATLDAANNLGCPLGNETAAA